jgi:AraC-like DNA-binding protein
MDKEFGAGNPVFLPVKALEIPVFQYHSAGMSLAIETGAAETLEADDGFLKASAFFAEHHIAEAMPEAHWHDHVELNLLRAGGMTYLFNGRRVPLAENQVYCFWAAIPHQVIAVEKPKTADRVDLVCVYVPFADFLALAMADGFKSAVMGGRILTLPKADPIDPLLFQRWATEWQSPDEQHEQILRDEVRLRVKRLAMHALPAATIEADAPESETEHQHLTADRKMIDRVQKMTTFINAEFGNPIQVEDVAKVGGLHPTNATVVFKKVLGMSIAQYLRRQRLSQAMMMLVDTDKAIIEIAFACGYGSLSRFYDAFQRHMGKTPRDYRMQFRK